MILGLFRKSPPGDAYALYRAIVAEARRPDYFTTLGVPDTVEGRFEMIVLVATLVFERAAAADADTAAVAQGTLDLFFTDMDRAMREMGVGDMSVPKKMKKVGEAYAGRSRAYRAALAEAGPAALEDALARNVYAGAAPDGAAGRLAVRTRTLVDALAATDPAAIRAGDLTFPALAPEEDRP